MSNKKFTLPPGKVYFARIYDDGLPGPQGLLGDGECGPVTVEIESDWPDLDGLAAGVSQGLGHKLVTD